jgi:hypothetical protein
VATIAEELGTPLMPWQRHVADVALEVDPRTSLLVYREVILTVPRQSGKTTLILSAAVHRALGFGERQVIVYGAQSRNDARQKWEDEHVVTLEASVFEPMLRVRKTNGNEAILWKNGSRHGITANTEKSGHGGTIDLAFLDEAFAQIDDRLEQAFKPAMITRPQPQLWIVSTAGTPESTYLKGKVDNGRQLAEAGVTEGIAYFEWSADENADPGAVETWKSCMPALGHTVSIEAVAADYASMKLSEFKRAYLNIWTAQRNDPVISAEDWERCRDSESKIVGPLALAFDVSPDRSSAAIAAAGINAQGLAHIEVIEHRSGTGWLVDRLTELVEAHEPSVVVCDAGGPAGSLVAALEAAEVEVKFASTREHQQACGALFDDVKDARLRHIGQPPLTAAVDGADRRQVSDAWLWSRKSSAVDISPLVAVTLARWAHETTDDEDPTEGVW